MMQCATAACFIQTSNRAHLQVPYRKNATFSVLGQPESLWGSWQFGTVIALQIGTQSEQSRSAAKRVPRTESRLCPVKSLCEGRKVLSGNGETSVEDQTLEFFDLIRNCFFHPARLETFPCAELWSRAMCALLLLWYEESVELFGVRYGNEQIRDRLLNQLTPDQIDTAVEFFMRQDESKSLRQLEMLILGVVLYGEMLTEWLYEHDQRLEEHLS